MAIGLVGGNWSFNWFGDRIKQAIDRHIDNKMHQTGQAVVARAQALAPVKTGALRASIYYLVQYNESGGRHVLHIRADVPYAIFQEFGTRNIPPHPFIRPALNEMSRIWGFDVNMGFAGQGYNAQAGTGWHGLLAGNRGFAASASHRFKPLTTKQVHHVRTKLIPTSKRLHRGNVRRSRMTVG